MALRSRPKGAFTMVLHHVVMSSKAQLQTIYVARIVARLEIGSYTGGLKTNENVRLKNINSGVAG